MKGKTFSFLIIVAALLVGIFSASLAASNVEMPVGETVRRSFGNFIHRWMENVIRCGTYGPRYIQVRTIRNGGKRYQAIYKEFGGIEASEVKATGVEDSPYVGTVSYVERVFACWGTTPMEARKGPFKEMYSVRVIEIFCFNNGRWLY